MSTSLIFTTNAYANVIREAKEAAWDERDRARASYLGPDHGHYKGCGGWEDCYCGTYPNPYREVSGGVGYVFHGFAGPEVIGGLPPRL